MTNLMLIFATALLLAYCSEHHVMVMERSNGKYVDFPTIIMIVMLSLYCGLRTAYNDTQAYISGFQNAVTLSEFWESKPTLWGNPLYYWFQSFFRHHISGNYHLFLLVIAFFTISCFVCFIKRSSEDYAFSILLFFCLGLYISTFAAVKQCLAMAVLTLAVSRLLEKKYLSFYLLVFVAMLFHTYAVMFAILPLFMRKPWTSVTYITVLAVVFILFTFQTTIMNFLEYAEELGKSINEAEVFETQSINVFRLAVFSVPPLLSLAFRRRLWLRLKLAGNVMINMSILSFLVMCLGLVSAANLFGRSAVYFEIGTIVILPWIIRELFTRRSAKLVFFIAAACYFAFFLYDVQSFIDSYTAISFRQLIISLLE